MFLDFLEKREETTDSITLTDEEKIFLKVFGIDSEQPAAAMREATYFFCKFLRLHVLLYSTCLPGR